MSWERRRNGRLYFYRARRLPDGRVAKEYVGGGCKGEEAAKEEEMKRAERQAQHQEESARRQHFQTATCVLRDINKQGTDLLEAVLLSAGYYRHNRGAWRRRRAAKKERG